MTPRVRSHDHEEGSPSQWLLENPRYSTSLQQGLEILALFTPQRPLLGVSDVARELEMPRSTTHRYMSTLVALGYLQQSTKRRYRLTLGVTRLGLSTLASTTLREHAHPYMQELSQRSSFTVSLAALDGAELIYLDRVQSPRRRPGPSDLDLEAGSRLPPHCTAMGKLLLAYLPHAEQTRLLQEITLTRKTPNTLTTKHALRAELRSIPGEGLAVNDQELTPGLHAIAVSIRSSTRQAIAALGMTAPTSTISLPDLLHHLTPSLRSTADHISARLGYRRE